MDAKKRVRRTRQEPQKDLMVNGLGIESKTYGRVEPSTLEAGFGSGVCGMGSWMTGWQE